MIVADNTEILLLDSNFLTIIKLFQLNAFVTFRAIQLKSYLHLLEFPGNYYVVFNFNKLQMYF